MNIKICYRPLLLLLSAALLNGCATSALWEEGRFARFREPDQPSDLRLLQSDSSDDVLVMYRETSDTSEKTRARAYWLNQNVTRIQERRKPHFVSMRQARDLSELPLLSSSADAPSGARMYAVVSTNGTADFSLYSQTGSRGTFQLPVYKDASGRVKQVFLTPFAVAADATIVGGVLAMWALPALVDTPYYAVDYR